VVAGERPKYSRGNPAIGLAVETVMRRWIPTALLGIAVAGCASSGPGQAGGHEAPSPPASGILVRTLLSPGCPTPPVGGACPVKPVAAKVTVIPAGSLTAAAAVSSGEDGRLTVHLHPGRYTVVASLDHPGQPCEHRKRHVTVTTREYTHLDVRFSSRIDGRLPS
jgi:hypothetical protein